MSSDVLERQLEDQHEVRMLHISPLDPDCKRVIEDAGRKAAERHRKAGWLRGERLQKFRGESQKKTEFVNVHPLDRKGSSTGKSRPAYYVDKRGGLYSWYDRAGVLKPARPEVMDPMERKHLEILLGINLSPVH